MRDRAIDKYDMFITASAPNSKNVKKIGNSYYKQVKRFERKLEGELEDMTIDQERNLAYMLGAGKLFDKKLKEKWHKD